jgi:hypothetical protein
VSPVTRVGKSSSLSVPAIHVHRDLILPARDEWVPLPLIPEPLHVRGARQWLDSGMPQNVDEYESWSK